MTNVYPAKLLLFGEYTIIDGSLALAVPHSEYIGYWQQETMEGKINQAQHSKKSLEKMFEYLQNLPHKTLSSCFIDLKKFSNDLKKGLWFDSSIPTGYGLGSSGAVCAAIYERYCPTPAEGLLQLKEELSQMEACFHGKSSGIDPLVSYLRKAVLIKNKEEIAVLPDFHPEHNKGRGAVFVIDTGLPRETTPLVNQYLKLAENPVFKANYVIPLSKLVETSIYSFLENDIAVLLESIRKISAIQHLYMSHLIPEAFKSAWVEGLRSGLYSLKLCGAGGGGFILGFTLDWVLTEEKLAALNCKQLYKL